MNATHVLATILASLSSTTDRLRDGAVPPTAEERDAWASLDPGAAVLESQGATPADPGAAAEFYERTLAAPAIDVNGLSGGEPDLLKTVLPVTAHANVSIPWRPDRTSNRSRRSSSRWSRTRRRRERTSSSSGCPPARQGSSR
jgi:hypothetical protein